MSEREIDLIEMECVTYSAPALLSATASKVRLKALIEKFTVHLKHH